MKSFLLYISIFVSSIGIAVAQPGDPAKREQKIQALYVAYITQELKLTEDEAQKFWPVHAQYDNEIKTVGANLNELDRQQASLNVKKKYQDRFNRIIGAERTNDFFRKDGEFRKKMIERLRKMRQQKQKLQQNDF
ncbi:MAG: hypothetical protein JWQ27_2670 [Ferruginibacter sp.]|nr:hypothetical protein [Ferruginibacter sp.]